MYNQTGSTSNEKKYAVFDYCQHFTASVRDIYKPKISRMSFKLDATWTGLSVWRSCHRDLYSFTVVVVVVRRYESMLSAMSLRVARRHPAITVDHPIHAWRRLASSSPAELAGRGPDEAASGPFQQSAAGVGRRSRSTESSCCLSVVGGARKRSPRSGSLLSILIWCTAAPPMSTYLRTVYLLTVAGHMNECLIPRDRASPAHLLASQSFIVSVPDYWSGCGKMPFRLVVWLKLSLFIRHTQSQ